MCNWFAWMYVGDEAIFVYLQVANKFIVIESNRKKKYKFSSLYRFEVEVEFDCFSFNSIPFH